MEFLGLTPLLVILIFALVQYGMYFFALQVTDAAAQAGARKARATADGDPAGWQGQARATTEQRIRDLGPAMVDGPDVHVVDEGNQVGVVVNADVVSVVPFLHLKITSRSVGPVERFIPDGG
ncbi:TadE family protein [Kitasatospora sp. NPDC049285]|uniref:TadE family protein n=1 Tax=Kitasatospora sp. NPDC049285 TaxID=3157096 RepID=UPI00342CF10A